MLDLPFLCWQPLTADSFPDLLSRNVADLFSSSHHMDLSVHFKTLDYKLVGYNHPIVVLNCQNPQVALLGCFLNGLVFLLVRSVKCDKTGSNKLMFL